MSAIDYSQGNARTRVDALRIGQRVDLQNDEYADPDAFAADGVIAAYGEPVTEHPEWEFEFEVVAEITLEPHDTDPCIVVEFESGFTCGFPPDHMVDVDSEQNLEAERPWRVTDEEARPQVIELARFATEDEASAWIGGQADKAKVFRGGYGLEGPADEDEGE